MRDSMGRDFIDGEQRITYSFYPCGTLEMKSFCMSSCFRYRKRRLKVCDSNVHFSIMTPPIYSIS